MKKGRGKTRLQGFGFLNIFDDGDDEFNYAADAGIGLFSLFPRARFRAPVDPEDSPRTCLSLRCGVVR